MFFNGWYGPLRTVVVGVLAYIGMVLLLRVMGKRTLSKMNDQLPLRRAPRPAPPAACQALPGA